MKRVAAFIGSPRKSGFTYDATRQFLDNLQSFGDIQGEVLFLSECNLAVCRGCKACQVSAIIKTFLDRLGFVFHRFSNRKRFIAGRTRECYGVVGSGPFQSGRAVVLLFSV